MEKRGVELSWTDDVEALVMKAGFDPAFGARPIRRAIQNDIENPLSLYMLKGEASKSVRLAVKDGAVIVE